MNLFGTTMFPSAGGAGGGGGASLSAANSWTAAQTMALEDAGTNTTLFPLVARRTTSGTAAQSLGVGVQFDLEDASGNTDTAATLSATWHAATGAAEVAGFTFRAMAAGAMTDLMRVGQAPTYPDSDVIFVMGRTRIDSRNTDSVYISHRDQTANTAFALAQAANGTTTLNCASGQSAIVAHAGTARFTANTTGLAFFAATPVAQQNITGSRGGNAALADLLTKLALTGLITDGTS